RFWGIRFLSWVLSPSSPRRSVRGRYAPATRGYRTRLLNAGPARQGRKGQQGRQRQEKSAADNLILPLLSLHSFLAHSRDVQKSSISPDRPWKTRRQRCTRSATLMDAKFAGSTMLHTRS